MSITVESNDMASQVKVMNAEAGEKAEEKQSDSAQENETEEKEEHQSDDDQNDADDESDQESQDDDEQDQDESEDEGDNQDEESEEDEESEDDQDDDKEEKSHEKGSKKRKDKVSKRIGKLVKQRNQMAEEAEFLRREVERLRNSNGPEKKEETENHQRSAQKQALYDDKGQELVKPSVDDFEDYDEYQEAMMDYKVEQRLAKERQANQQREQQAKFNQKLDSFKQQSAKLRKSIPDFREVMEDVGVIPLTQEVEEAILESDMSAAVYYELSKNPENLMKVNQLRGAALYKAIGRAEARAEKLLDSSTSRSSQLKPNKKGHLNAPKPLEKVGTKGSGSPKTIYSKGLTQKEYEELRMKMGQKS